MKKEEKKLSNKNFFEAWKNAVNGLIYATTTQSNIKKQLVIAVIVMALSLFYKLSKTEFLCLVFAVFFVIFAEMINTAIETVVDLYTDIYHPKAKIAKDVGAGAVVLSAMNAIIVAYFIFFDKLQIIEKTVLESIVSMPIHLAFTTIVFVVISILVAKAIKTKRNLNINLSGQTILAFAILSIIFITTTSILVLAASSVLTLMVTLNRADQKKQKAVEIFFSMFFGILIVMLTYGLAIIYVL